MRVCVIDLVLFFHFLFCAADGAVKKRVEDVTPIATGHKREELEALAAATAAAPTRSITHTVSQIREAAKVIKSLPGISYFF